MRIIRLRRVPFIDSTGLSNLQAFIDRASNHEIKIVLSGAGAQVLLNLRKAGIIDLLGNENNCEDIQSALKKRAKTMIKENLNTNKSE